MEYYLKGLAKVSHTFSLQKIVFAKPGSYLNSASFSHQGETQPRLATTLPKNSKGNRAKKNRMSGGELELWRDKIH